MLKATVALLVAALAIAALTWGLCVPITQTRCIVHSSGIFVGSRSLVGPTNNFDIMPGLSIRTWGIIDWHKIESIRIVQGLFGAYIRVRYLASDVYRSIDIGPLDERCEREVRERLTGDPKFSS